jgi:hypothetical protein
MTVAGLVVAVSLLVLSGCSLERWDAVVEVKVPGDAVPGEWVRLDGTPYRVVQAETAKVARIRVGIYFSPESCKKAALAEYERRQNSELPVHRYRCDRVPLLG